MKIISSKKYRLLIESKEQLERIRKQIVIHPKMTFVSVDFSKYIGFSCDFSEQDSEYITEQGTFIMAIKQGREKEFDYILKNKENRTCKSGDLILIYKIEG